MFQIIFRYIYNIKSSQYKLGYYNKKLNRCLYKFRMDVPRTRIITFRGGRGLKRTNIENCLKKWSPADLIATISHQYVHCRIMTQILRIKMSSTQEPSKPDVG